MSHLRLKLMINRQILGLKYDRNVEDEAFECCRKTDMWALDVNYKFVSYLCGTQHMNKNF